jgi:hypothetical protein
LLAIDIIVPKTRPWHWQKLLIDRLRQQGHDVGVQAQEGTSGVPFVLAAMLGLERTVFRRKSAALASPAEIAEAQRMRRPELGIDLTGQAAGSEVPIVALAFDGSPSPSAIVAALAEGRLPTIEAVLDGHTVIGRALPMVDKRESIALGLEDVLARALTLLDSVVRSAAGSRLARIGPISTVERKARGGLGVAAAYGAAALPRLGREAIRRARFRHAHWRVGYRLIDGAGVAETNELGNGWSELSDPGDRFYADPFAFEHDGLRFIFVEDYSHQTKKAVISVAVLDGRGVAGKPYPVLEEPHHLSYPQVFERDGAIWMLPEASASGRLTLYRAVSFPDRWTADASLLQGREISDATLLEHGGLSWLFATDRDGFGSTSDTLVVFHAASLLGPWTAHPMNPILIDRRAARPGGAFIRRDNRIFLPVQDGTLGYGGGLGIAEILELDRASVRMSAPVPIAPEGDWQHPRIHTLNRWGRLEVIDGIVSVRKGQR